MQFILTDFICNNSMEDKVQKRILMKTCFKTDVDRVLHR